MDVTVSIENEQDVSKLVAQAYIEILKMRLQSVPVDLRLEIYQEILEVLRKGARI